MYIGVIGIKKLRKATLISRIEKKYDFFIKLNIFLEYSFFTHMVTAFNHIIFVFFFDDQISNWSSKSLFDN